MLASVTAALALREHHKCESTSSNHRQPTPPEIARAHQASQPASLPLAPASLLLQESCLASCRLAITKPLQGRMLSLAQASLLLQELCPATCWLVIIWLLQGRTPTLTQASWLWREFSPVFIRHALLPWLSVILILAVINICYSFTWLPLRPLTFPHITWYEWKIIHMYFYALYFNTLCVQETF
jgi:hypothetical protein